VLLVLGAAAACGSRGAEPAARLSARIIRQSRDTLRFEAAAAANLCGRAVGDGVVLQGSAHGNGVLIYVRSSDSAPSGEFPLMARADSTTARGAIVTARFQAGDRAGDVLSATARGAGAEVAGTGRLALTASFESVRMGPDTVQCTARL